MAAMYQPLRPSRSAHVPVRNQHYHVRLWGEPGPGKRPLVMVHGWMDVSASYQFVVDAFERDYYVIAPDWRGFGLTRGDPVDGYWFADYLADLDCLLDHYAGDQPVDLVGHSMGGNVAMMYAGVRPARIRKLVNLEGFGTPRTQAEEIPGRYGKWIDELKKFHRGEIGLAPYGTLAEVAQRLMKTNRRLTQDKADWLAQHWAQAGTGTDGQAQWRILGDPAHKLMLAQPVRVEEILTLYRAITAPVLAVEASDDSLRGWWKGRYSLDEYHERLQNIAHCSIAQI